MAKKSRDKGKRGERAIVHKCREKGFTEARRGIQSRGGQECSDIIGVPGYHIEVKTQRKVAMRKAWEQAQADADLTLNHTAVAVCVDDRKPPLVVIDLDAFLDLISELEAYANANNRAMDALENLGR